MKYVVNLNALPVLLFRDNNVTFYLRYLWRENIESGISHKHTKRTPIYEIK